LQFKVVLYICVILRLQGYNFVAFFIFVIIFNVRGGDLSMANGTVKWFNDKKGFGFISQDNGDDVFVHQTSIQGEGFRTLAEGDKVEFEVMKDAKGYKASNVVKL